MKTISIVMTILFFIVGCVGCATAPTNIKPAYVSPLKYSNYSCEQIQQEYNRLNQKLTELTQKQEKSANIDAAAMGIGMILFWPALFFLIGGDHETELAQLKGDYEAIEMIAIGNKCSFAPEIQADREKRIEEAEKLNTGKRLVIAFNRIKLKLLIGDNGEVSSAPWKRGAAGSTPASPTKI